MRHFQTIDTELDPLVALFRERGTEMKYQPGATIASQGSASDTIFRVLRGCVRVCAYSENGERRILQFLRPGDFIGLDDIDECITAREAVDMVVLAAISRRTFELELRQSDHFQKAVRRQLAQEIDAHATLFILTAQTSAVERVKLFLTTFAERRPSKGFVALPMCRRDIADHLGLSMETVSRAFSTLKERGEITLKGATFFRPSDAAPAETFVDAA